MPTQIETLTPEEYLVIEREAEFKHDYWNGHMYCTAGAAEAHNSINVNVSGDLHQQLRSRPCHVLASLMRVRTPSNLFTYPDVLVVCDKPVFLDEQEDTQPKPHRGSAIALYRAL
ncbi:MAG: Uma2 family endonuclease [Bryobacteraceae bacterium]